MAPNKGEQTKNKSLNDIQVPNWLVAVIIAVIAIIVCMYLFLSGPKNSQLVNIGTTTFSSEASPDANQIEVLPQIVRNFNGEEIKNPFASKDQLGAVKITGIISNSHGKMTAILQGENASYIVGEGELLPGSTWSVKEITSNAVTFTCEDSEKILFINQSNSVTANNNIITNSGVNQ